jgi:hypothetical protein
MHTAALAGASGGSNLSDSVAAYDFHARLPLVYPLLYIEPFLGTYQG